MVYIPDDIFKQLTEPKESDRDLNFPIAKFILMGTDYCWLISEIDPGNPNLAYGISFEGEKVEKGVIDLRHLDSIRGPDCRGESNTTIFTEEELIAPIVSIDIAFEPIHPLIVYHSVAKELGMISTDNDKYKTVWEKYSL